MSFADFFRNQRAKQERAFRDSAEDALRAGLDAVALAKSRVQQFGEDGDGSKFEDYVPTYAKRRARGGYQISHVDFTVTGKMWASVVPAIQSATDKEITVVIKATNEADQTKINGQFKKRGNILANTPEEEAIVLRAFNEGLAERLR